MRVYIVIRNLVGKNGASMAVPVRAYATEAEAKAGAAEAHAGMKAAAECQLMMLAGGQAHDSGLDCETFLREIGIHSYSHAVAWYEVAGTLEMPEDKKVTLM